MMYIHTYCNKPAKIRCSHGHAIRFSLIDAKQCVTVHLYPMSYKCTVINPHIYCAVSHNHAMRFTLVAARQQVAVHLYLMYIPIYCNKPANILCSESRSSPVFHLGSCRLLSLCYSSWRWYICVETTEWRIRRSRGERWCWQGGGWGGGLNLGNSRSSCRCRW